MNTYTVLKTKQCEYNWLIIVTSYISPLSVLDDLIKKLKPFSGQVLFDLTLINGTANNRYISAVLDQGAFVKTSFKVVSDTFYGLKSISRQFFLKHLSVVDESVISNSLKYLLKEGTIL